jgi:hypothetical protein
MAEAGEGRLLGMILHDRPEMGANEEQTVSALQALDQALGTLPNAPILFLEFGCTLSLEAYDRLIASVSALPLISSCIDIGHIGLTAVQVHFEAKTGVELSTLRGQSLAPDLLPPLHEAMAAALPAVTSLIQSVGCHGKPLHLHLHDGHPLSTLSRWGVSDHLSFLQPLSIEVEGQPTLLEPGIFGVGGLQQILHSVTRKDMPPASLAIEIHPQPGRTPLGRFEPLFHHWEDRSGAEAMNAWIDTLQATTLLIQGLLTEEGMA